MTLTELPSAVGDVRLGVTQHRMNTLQPNCQDSGISRLCPYIQGYEFAEHVL